MDDSILAAFLRNCLHLVVVIDPLGRIVWVNAAFERTSGYTLDEVRGREPGSFLHGPETDPEVVARLMHAGRSGLPVHGLELANYRRDGSVYWIELEFLPLRDASGAVTYCVGLQDDITEWKRAQSQFRSSERLLNEAARIAHVGAWDLDAVSHDLRWSDQTYAIHEVPLGTPLNLEYAFSFFTAASQSLLRAAVDRAIATGEAYDLEVELVTARGQRRWARAIGNAEMHGGRVVRLAGTFQDVTERHQAREQIAELAERLKMATDASGIGVWEYDMATNVVSNNELVNRLFGLPPDANPTPEEWFEMIHPEDRERARALRNRMRDPAEPKHDFEYRLLRPNGELCHLRAIGRRVETAAGPKVIGLLMDVTETRRSEQARMEKEAAERANRAKSEFLSRVSHELRTPLNGVLGFAQLLALDATALSARQREQIGQIQRAGEHLLQIVNDMLDLASIEAGAMRLSPEAVALAEVVDDALALVRPMADDRGIALQLQPPPDATRLAVLADRTRLRQVLVNLLSNAIKYNRLQGKVIVSWKREADMGCLRVRDTGAGLRPQELQQLFQPFNRLGAEATTIGGTGLGLSITRRLMEAMGGQIDVSSTPGMGTQFRLSLPLAMVPAQLPALAHEAAAPAAADEAQGGEVLLFYVEDNPTNVLLLRHALARLGPRFRLEVATDGEQALARLATLRPDLVLLDINLPGISGYDVLRQLDQVLGTARPPCVAVSADAMPEELARARAAGFDDYWTKPLDLIRLGERLEAALATGKAAE